MKVVLTFGLEARKSGTRMPTQKPAGGKGGRTTDGDEARTPLQAVVLADSFTQVRLCSVNREIFWRY